MTLQTFLQRVSDNPECDSVPWEDINRTVRGCFAELRRMNPSEAAALLAHLMQGGLETSQSSPDGGASPA